MYMGVRVDNPRGDDEIERLRAKRRQLLTERDSLADRAIDGNTQTAGVVDRIERLDTGIAQLDEQIERASDEWGQRIAADVASGAYRVERGSDVSSTWSDGYTGAAPAQTRDAARRTLDDVHTRSGVPDDALERAEQLLNTPDPRSRQVASDWVGTTGSPDYEQAFLKLMADPDRGHLLWTEREAAAFRDTELVRAMSLSDTAGGFMVPFQLDPSIMLTSAGSIDPVRQIARVVTATGDVRNGVSSAGASAEWLAEATEAADGSPTIAQPTVPVHKFDCFIPYSFEVGMDGANFLEEIGVVMRDAVDSLQAAAFATGTGSGQPTGIVTALTGTGSVVNSATTDTFARADVFALQNALPREVPTPGPVGHVAAGHQPDRPVRTVHRRGARVPVGAGRHAATQAVARMVQPRLRDQRHPGQPHRRLRRLVALRHRRQDRLHPRDHPEFVRGEPAAHRATGRPAVGSCRCRLCGG
jgi:HK97 family phage major capsid protein